VTQTTRHYSFTADRQAKALRFAVFISQQQLKRYRNKTPIKKLKICALVGYYAAYNGNSFPTFRYNLSVPYSRVSPTRTRRKPEITHSTRLWEGYSASCPEIRNSLNQEGQTPYSALLPTPLHGPEYLNRASYCTVTTTDRQPAASTCFWAFFLDFLTLEDGTDKFSRDVGK